MAVASGIERYVLGSFAAGNREVVIIGDGNEHDFDDLTPIAVSDDSVKFPHPDA